MEDLGKFGNLDIFEFLKNYNFNGKVEDMLRNMPKLNIVNIGKTGIGKSVLINAVFGQELAKTGTGLPVTEHCERYTFGDSPITIYDSRGIETGEQGTKGLDEVYGVISRQNASNNPNEYIHICWYCLSGPGLKIEPNEITIINKIRAGIPVILVITQFAGTAEQKEFVEKVRGVFGDRPPDVIPVMALPQVSQSEFGEMNIKAHGVDKLVKRSYELLSDSQKKTFAAYQKQSVQLKIDTARKISFAYAAAVAAAAFQPLPIADAPIMVAIQVAMMAHITACFGIDASVNFKTVISGLGGPFAAAVVGRTLVSLLKLIPGLGTLAGGAINAATGGALTIALANIYIGVLASILRSGEKIDAQTIAEELKKATENVNMDEMEKEWEKIKDSSSKSEVDAIRSDAEKSLESLNKDKS